MSGSLERGPDLELETLDSIRALVAKRLAPAELERTDRRDPAQAETGGHTQRVEGHSFIPHVAGVHVGEEAQGPVVAGAGDRQIQLAVEVEAACAADVAALHVYG